MENNKGGLGKFIAGAAIGVGLGVLFAPKSGKETRKELKEKFDEIVNNIKEIDVEEVRENFLNKIEEVKAEIADLDKEKVVSIAKEKANDIKNKLDDLISEAKEKATPLVEKTLEDLKEKTIIVLKNTIDKLENAESDGQKQITTKKKGKKDKENKETK